MVYTSTLTKKGQVTIPIELREPFNLEEGGKVFIEPSPDKKRIILRPSKSIFDLADSFKPKKPVSAVEARKKMAKNYRPR